MNALRSIQTLLVLLIAAAIQLPAQQSEAARNRFEETKTIAEKGDAKAQFSLANDYRTGNGVAKNTVEAAKWFRKAAEQGHVKAQFNLGACYAYGQGVTNDYAQAVKWYRLAAEHGEMRAQYYLGNCYAFGKGVTKDDVQAAKWFREAADQGDLKAQQALGVCYATASGVAKDYAEAVNWYRKAADQGLAEAQVNLGACYGTGEGVPVDAVEAAKWYRKAAEQGNAVAEKTLGARYILGDGVPKDAVEAYKWLNLASAQGNEAAKELLSAHELLMTTQQIAEAQRLAHEFKPRKISGGIDPASPSSTGTGFFITEDGFLITNEHVVKEAAQVKLVTSAGIIVARVVKVDAANDLALLKAEGKFQALPVVASRAMRLGSTTATVGFPNVGLQGFAPKLARGEIASLSGAQDDARYFQISVPVQPGNSGGALVDERGNVVGVVSAKLNARAALAASGALPENVNYAVKSSFLLSFLESVPEVAAKLKDANTKERKFEDVVKSAEQAAVLVLVY